VISSLYPGDQGEGLSTPRLHEGKDEVVFRKEICLRAGNVLLPATSLTERCAPKHPWAANVTRQREQTQTCRWAERKTTGGGMSNSNSCHPSPRHGTLASQKKGTGCERPMPFSCRLPTPSFVSSPSCLRRRVGGHWTQQGLPQEQYRTNCSSVNMCFSTALLLSRRGGWYQDPSAFKNRCLQQSNLEVMDSKEAQCVVPKRPLSSRHERVECEPLAMALMHDLPCFPPTSLLSRDSGTHQHGPVSGTARELIQHSHCVGSLTSQMQMLTGLPRGPRLGCARIKASCMHPS
jgi:hypothetical protein